MSIETVKKDLREMMKLTRKQTALSDAGAETRYSVKNSDTDWTRVIAPEDGAFSFEVAEYKVELRNDTSGLRSSVWRDADGFRAVWILARKGDRIAAKAHAPGGSSTFDALKFIPCVGAV